MTELGREEPEDERRLKRTVSQWLANKDRTRIVPAVQLGQQTAGIHPQRTRQIVRTWANDGLVSSVDGANKMTLTEEGFEHFGLE